MLFRLYLQKGAKVRCGFSRHFQIAVRQTNQRIVHLHAYVLQSVRYDARRVVIQHQHAEEHNVQKRYATRVMNRNDHGTCERA